MNELRINARLDEQAANDLEFLKDSTHANNTEALKAALHFYADFLRNEAQRSKQALLDSGFIGSFNYLIGMRISSLTIERISNLEEEIKKLKTIHNQIKNKHINDMWIDDLEDLESAIK